MIVLGERRHRLQILQRRRCAHPGAVHIVAAQLYRQAHWPAKTHGPGCGTTRTRACPNRTATGRKRAACRAPSFAARTHTPAREIGPRPARPPSPPRPPSARRVARLPPLPTSAAFAPASPFAPATGLPASHAASVPANAVTVSASSAPRATFVTFVPGLARTTRRRAGRRTRVSRISARPIRIG